jgi:hypothetical protein
MPHVFISYSKKNRAYARGLADHLIAHGFDVWIDDRIDYGARWEDVIEKAIIECGAFVVVMTPESRESLWVRNECETAWQLGKPTFPILLAGSCFFRYRTTQYSDCTGGRFPPEDFYADLAQQVPRQAAGRDVADAPLAQAALTTPAEDDDEPHAPVDDDDRADAAPPPAPAVTLAEPDPAAVPAASPAPIPAGRPVSRMLLAIALVAVVAFAGLIALNAAGVFSTQADTAAQASTTPEAPNVLLRVFDAGDAANERIEIHNGGFDPIQIDNWRLTTSSGLSYRFAPDPERILYGAGSVALYTGAGPDTSASLYWGRSQPIWYSGETATLYDAEGREQASLVVP